MTVIRCSIHKVNRLNGHTDQVFLSCTNGVPPQFKAGQYLELILPSGKTCPFSIANAPSHSATIELHIRPTPGSEDSAEIQKLIAKHEILEINAPLGKCFVDEVPDTPLLLLAASTGITQMKSIIEFLMERGMQNSVYLYWGVVHVADLYLHELCSNWAQASEMFHYTPVVSGPDSEKVWKGRTGLVAEVVAEDIVQFNTHAAIISGSKAMVVASREVLLHAGMADANIRSDILDILAAAS